MFLSAGGQKVIPKVDFIQNYTMVVINILKVIQSTFEKLIFSASRRPIPPPFEQSWN